MQRIEELIEIAKRKNEFDQKGTWSKGSKTYYQAMFEELEEVKEEIDSERRCYLEDELGDILWVYLCLLRNLEVEEKISMDSVFSRAIEKYKERVGGIEAGSSWSDIKKVQNKRLAKEQKANRKKR